MAILEGTITKQVDQTFGAGKAAEALDDKVLCNGEFLSPIASFVQTQAVDSMNDQTTVEYFNPPPWQLLPGRTQSWQLRQTFFTKHWLVQIRRSLMRSATEVVGNAVEATYLQSRPPKQEQQLKRVRIDGINE